MDIKKWGYTVSVSEQEPAGNSIFCEVKITNEGSSLRYSGQMYFVCDINRNITQYFPWMKSNKEFREQLNQLNYKL